MDIEEQVAVNMCGFDGSRRGNYFRETVRTNIVEARTKKLEC